MSRRKVQQWVSHAVSAVVAKLYMLWGGIQVPEVLLPDYSTHTAEATASTSEWHEDIVGQFQNIELKENIAYGPVQQFHAFAIHTNKICS